MPEDRQTKLLAEFTKYYEQGIERGKALEAQKQALQVEINDLAKSLLVV